MLLEKIRRITDTISLRMGLQSGGFDRKERNLIVALNALPCIIEVRDDVLPGIARDILANRILGRAFHCPASALTKVAFDVSFYTEGEDVLIRFQKPDEIYGLTLFWRGGPRLFFYADMSERQSDQSEIDHVRQMSPLIRHFRDRFMLERGDVAGSRLSFETDYFHGLESHE